MNPQFIFFVRHSFQVLLIKFSVSDPFSQCTATVILQGLNFCGVITEPFFGFPPSVFALHLLMFLSCGQFSSIMLVWIVRLFMIVNLPSHWLRLILCPSSVFPSLWRLINQCSLNLVRAEPYKLCHHHVAQCLL